MNHKYIILQEDTFDKLGHILYKSMPYTLKNSHIFSCFCEYSYEYCTLTHKKNNQVWHIWGNMNIVAENRIVHK